MVQLVYLFKYKPFKETFAQRIEEFNEVGNLVLLITMTSFTDYVSDNQVKYNLGFVYIGAIIIYLSVHLYFIGKDAFLNVKGYCKNKCSKKEQVKNGQMPQEIQLGDKSTA